MRPTAIRSHPSNRRSFVSNQHTSPRPLVLANLAAARHQLADARDNLKAGRRRVVQLEDAVVNWEAFAAQLAENPTGWESANSAA